MHPEDATTRGLVDGDTVAVSNARGRLCLPLVVREEIVPGTVCIPDRLAEEDAWRGGHQRADAARGDGHGRGRDLLMRRFRSPRRSPRGGVQRLRRRVSVCGAVVAVIDPAEGARRR